MRVALVPAALLGAGAGLYFHGLHRIFEASFWPRIGGAHFVFSLIGAPVAAAAVYLFCAELKGEGGDGKGWPWLGWGVSSLVVIFVMEHAFLMEKGVDTVALPLSLLLLLSTPAFAATASLLAGCEDADPPEASGIFLLLLGAGVLAASLLSCLHPRTVALSGAALGTLPPLLGRGRRKPALAAGVLLVVLASAGYGAAGAYGERRDSAAVPEGRAPRTVTETWCGTERLEVLVGTGGDPLVTIGEGLGRSLVRTARGPRPAVPLPEPPDGTLDILAVGYPAGDWLALFHELRSRKGGGEVSLTVLEPSRKLPLLAGRVWPENAEAAREGTLRVVGGNPRWFLRQSRERFDLVLFGAAPSPAAYLESALGFRENHLYTVEAFRDVLRRLEPGGLLHFRRPGTARVVSTLREAAGGPVEFSRQVVVLGGWGRLISECFFRPRGFGAEDLAALNDYSRKTRTAILYSPETWRRWNLYFDLARGEGVAGYYFTTPQDLSPGTDRRPFFEHFQRLAISPHGSPMPEDAGRLGSDWKVRFLPPGDLVWWQVLLWCLLLAAPVIGLPAALHRHRTGLAGHLSSSLAPLFWLGLAAGATVRSALAGARWLDPLPAREGWALALLLSAAGAGWYLSITRSWEWRKGAISLAAVCGATGLAWHALPVPAGAPGPAGWMLLLVGLLLASGAAAGAATGSCISVSTRVFPGAAALLSAPLLLGTVASLAAGTLLAVFFGFPLIWLLAASFSLFALRTGREL